MKKQRTAVAADAATAKPADPATPKVKTETAASTAANQPPKQRNARAKKPDPQVVQKVRTEHVNFKAQPRPNKVPTVTYNESYRINGAQQWQGPQYEVFRTYRPQRHDERLVSRPLSPRSKSLPAALITSITASGSRPGVTIPPTNIMPTTPRFMSGAAPSRPIA